MEITRFFQEPEIQLNSSEADDLGTKIVRELEKYEKGMTRKQLVVRFTTPRTTIYDAIRSYLASGAVKKVNRKPEKRRPGRSDVYFVLETKEKKE